MNARWIGVALVTAISATPAPAQVPDAPPDTARLVDVGGFGLRVRTAGWEHLGPDRPVVVFESGGAGDRIEVWDTVFEEVARFAPVVAYERPGTGGSETDGTAPSLRFLNQTLRALLRTLGAEPPFVLVGHSFGGPLVRDFAVRYPEEVSGLVYLDATFLMQTHEDRLAAFESIGGGEAELREFERALENHVDAMAPGPRAEIRAVEEELRSAPPMRIPEVPVAILLAGRCDPPPPGIQLSFDFCAYHEANLRREIRRLTDRVLEAPTGTLVVATGAGHYIHHDDPALVVAAIRRVVFAGREP